MGLKQQSAIEFIITYSLALLIIGLFVISVFIISDSRAPVSYLGSTCSIQPLFPCSETLLTYNATKPLQYYMLFNNELGSVVYFPPNAINITTTNIGTPGIGYSVGNCTPSFASTGSQILCSVNIAGSVKPSIGSQASISFIISYNICRTNKLSSCAKGLYKSSGYSIQTVAPTSVRLNSLQLLTTSSATISINGATYFNGITTYLPSGNYIIFANPAPTHNFLSWSISGSNSAVSNTISMNTTLSLYSNAILTATTN